VSRSYVACSKGNHVEITQINSHCKAKPPAQVTSSETFGMFVVGGRVLQGVYSNSLSCRLHLSCPPPLHKIHPNELYWQDE